MKKLPKSARIFLRKEKARIRRQFSDLPEVAQKIQEIRESLSKQYLKAVKEVAA